MVFGSNIKPAGAADPVVRAVLFFSPTCPHCHKVISEDLPPLAKEYGDQLEIIGIDVSYDVGQNLYQSAVARFDVPDNRIGVPTLVVGDNVLVGAQEIPDIFPLIIKEGLAAGGIDWPDIPGLEEVLNVQLNQSQGEQSDDNQSGSDQKGAIASNMNFIGKFNQDPVANSIAVIVLFGMVASVIGAGYSFIKGTESKILNWPRWVLPVLAIVGLFASLYLTYVELSHAEAVCGPIGDCNTVQQSPYAYLFGVVSVGMIGIIGYITILISWFFQQFGPESLKKYFSLLIWGMAWFGVLFSIYLTFLEPFVIGATCAWCITSAVVMTLILLASLEPAKVALHSDFDEFEDDEIELEEMEEFETDPEDVNPMELV